MAYEVQLYKNTSGTHHTSKTLISFGTVQCDIKDVTNKERPLITIAATDFYDGVNYIYIPHFGRYYYASVDVGRGQVVTYDCKSDPLMSFRSQILQCPVIVTKNPWKYDMYLPDPDLPVESRTVKSILKFPNNPFNGNFNSYIITTLGPGGDIAGISQQIEEPTNEG